MNAKAMKARDDRARAFLADPNNWPRWPILPVMSRGDTNGDKACGFVHASKPDRVYFANIYRLSEIDAGYKTWAEVLAKLESREFTSPDALLAEYRID